jgi:NitT/TauT family transport system substrate-binding protein
MTRVLKAIFVLFLLVLPSELFTAAVAHAEDMPTITVRTDWAPWGLHAGLHLANQKGWFKNAGLNVVVTDGTGSSAVLQQVATGNIDVGWVSHGTAAVARCQAGLPVVGIYQLGRKGDIGLMVPEGQYTSITQLKGRKIGFAAGGFTPFLDVFLQAGGAKNSDFDLVNVDSASLASAYVSGRVDAVLAGVAYFLPTVSKQRPAGSILMSDVGINSPGFGLVTTPKVIQEKGDSLEKLVKVLTR